MAGCSDDHDGKRDDATGATGGSGDQNAGGRSVLGGGGAGGATDGTGGGSDAGSPTACSPVCGVGLPGGVPFLSCCDGTCRDTGNDPMNCGGCGQTCEIARPFCDYGACKATPCETGCDGGECCGFECCGSGETCCNVGGPMGPKPNCTSLAEGETCPHACYDCMCASPSTPIATPAGERSIVDLAVGDLVYSVDHEAIVAVPIARVNRTPVEPNHRMLRVMLSSGRVLEMSGGHPLPGIGHFDDLKPASALDGVHVVDVQVVDYDHDATYDILPASDTETYFAAGLLVGSTLSARR